MSSNTIIALRKQIDAIDRRVIRLVARRMRLAHRIGIIKRRDSLPLQDTSREKSLIADRIRYGRILGLQKKDVHEVMRILLACARRIQKE